jgi:HEAT repeat protein
LEALQDRYSEIRYSAEAGLIKLGKISVEPLVALLNTASADVQINVCKTLGQIGDKTALPVLNTQAQSPNKNLHWGCD